MINKQYCRTWTEINIQQLEKNFDYIKNTYIKNKNIMCVVKSNAYGHGMIEIVDKLKKKGVSFFCVSTISEAIELKKKFSNIDVLLFGYFNITHVFDIIKYNIIISIYNNYTLDLIFLLKKFNIKAHIKLDTGMSRLGFHYKKINKLLINKLKKISSNISGIYTHFSSSDTDIKFTQKQFIRFKKIIKKIENNIGYIENKHCSNTFASTYIKDNICNFVRLGIGLYGYGVDKNIKPIMTFKSRIVQIKNMKQGEFISYNKTFILEKKTKIAIVSVGYADGYLRSNSNKGYVYINNERANIIGNVCMDMLIVDISNINNININNEVTLFNDSYFTAEKLAKINNTISYEIICLINQRVPRIYNK